ncbi:metallophosphoesterase family protein [Caldimonas tepidiphila]|uniref:metallophosphoesterase family protein n=1 Tax=Caldimonas tepidiphila TaxID=2315841 RepID=UPI000E5AD2A3|nr:metallophosphoesterase family protein [Caldimonas tepidiphila]
MKIGLISDTHGLLRPEALAVLRGSEHIVHVGDVGSPAVLAQLAAIAPLTAVRGNNDSGAWAEALPHSAALRLAGIVIFAVHRPQDVPAGAAEAGYRVVLTGHTHQPRCEERDGVLHVNPGSAGPRRFRLPVSAGWLEIRDDVVRARLFDLL